MSSIKLLPHLLRRIQLSISQKKQMRADADRTELHGKELDRREVRIMLAYYFFQWITYSPFASNPSLNISEKADAS